MTDEEVEAVARVELRLMGFTAEGLTCILKENPHLTCRQIMKNINEPWVSREMIESSMARWNKHALMDERND